MAAAFSTLRSAFAGISPRERRLLTTLGVVLGVLLFFGLYLWSSSALDEIETERAQAVDALRWSACCAEGRGGVRGGGGGGGSLPPGTPLPGGPAGHEGGAHPRKHALPGGRGGGGGGGAGGGGLIPPGGGVPGARRRGGGGLPTVGGGAGGGGLLWL